MENGPFEDVFPLKIGIFHCYVSLPEFTRVYQSVSMSILRGIKTLVFSTSWGIPEPWSMCKPCVSWCGLCVTVVGPYIFGIDVCTKMHSLKLTVRSWKWMVGILGHPFGIRPIFSGELLVLGSVPWVYLFFFWVACLRKRLNMMLTCDWHPGKHWHWKPRNYMVWYTVRCIWLQSSGDAGEWSHQIYNTQEKVL